MNQIARSTLYCTIALLLILLAVVLYPQFMESSVNADSEEDPSVYLPIIQTESDLSHPTGEIVFTSWRSGDPFLYTMGADGSSPAMVKLYGEAQYDPTWSPSNEQIAFSALTGHQPCSNPQYTCAVWDIIIMNRDGTQVSNLTEPLDNNTNRHPVWSPDGSEIAFHSGNSPWCDYASILKTANPAEIDWTDAYGYLQDWSPDGKYLLLTVYEYDSFPGYCDEMDQGIYKYDIETITSTRIFSGPAHNASWASNGIDIVFAGGNDIYLIQADGSNVQKIATEDGFVTSLSWSPDAQWITYASDQNGPEDVFIISRDGQDRKQMTADPATDISPDWSN